MCQDLGRRTLRINAKDSERPTDSQDELKPLFNVVLIEPEIAANTGKSESEVKTAMLERTTLNPEEAKAWGLVDEIKSELFESGAEIISIQSAT